LQGYACFRAKNTSLAAVLLSCFGVIAKVLYDHVHGLT
jgi:hypothetical protein